jgi:hypothetical protein
MIKMMMMIVHREQTTKARQPSLRSIMRKSRDDNHADEI